MMDCTCKLATLPKAKILSVDAPWKFVDSLPGEKRGAAKHYAVMETRDIIRLPLPPIDDNAMLLFWRVAAMQQDALDVIAAWGFTLKSEIVWIKKTEHGKLHFGMGHTTRASHETCLIATRGRFHVKDRSIRSIFDTIEFEAKVGEHSEKPDEFYAIAERFADGPYVELFGRKSRPGWHVLGNQMENGYVYTPPSAAQIASASTTEGAVSSSVDPKTNSAAPTEVQTSSTTTSNTNGSAPIEPQTSASRINGAAPVEPQTSSVASNEAAPVEPQTHANPVTNLLIGHTYAIEDLNGISVVLITHGSTRGGGQYRGKLLSDRPPCKTGDGLTFDVEKMVSAVEVDASPRKDGDETEEGNSEVAVAALRAVVATSLVSAEFAEAGGVYEVTQSDKRPFRMLVERVVKNTNVTPMGVSLIGKRVGGPDSGKGLSVELSFNQGIRPIEDEDDEASAATSQIVAAVVADEKVKRGSVKGVGKVCGVCGEVGHNKRTCPKANGAVSAEKTDAKANGAADAFAIWRACAAQADIAEAAEIGG